VLTCANVSEYFDNSQEWRQMPLRQWNGSFQQDLDSVKLVQ
jgi:hypothetical protein